ncbi:MAG: nodulation protein NfeD, partial [Bacteroidetes bacterium]|nr:nodulation protein NfeD [Bacteroidota bacterium]
FDTTMQSSMVGKTGTAHTYLRPSGKIEIESHIYDAISEIGFISKGENVRVTRQETGQLYVERYE